MIPDVSASAMRICAVNLTGFKITWNVGTVDVSRRVFFSERINWEGRFILNIGSTSPSLGAMRKLKEATGKTGGHEDSSFSASVLT